MILASHDDAMRVAWREVECFDLNSLLDMRTYNSIVSRASLMPWSFQRQGILRRGRGNEEDMYTLGITTSGAVNCV